MQSSQTQLVRTKLLGPNIGCQQTGSAINLLSLLCSGKKVTLEPLISPSISDLSDFWQFARYCSYPWPSNTTLKFSSLFLSTWLILRQQIFTTSLSFCQSWQNSSIIVYKHQHQPATDTQLTGARVQFVLIFIIWKKD